MKIYNVDILEVCPQCGATDPQIKYEGIELDTLDQPMYSMWQCLECNGTVFGMKANGMALLSCEYLIMEKAKMPGAIMDISTFEEVESNGVHLEVTHPECYYDLVVTVGSQPVYLAKVRSRKYYDLYDYDHVKPKRTRARHHMIQVAVVGPTWNWHYLKVCRLRDLVRLLQGMSGSSFASPFLEAFAEARGWPEEIVREEIEQ